MEAVKANPMQTPNQVGLTKKDYQGLASTLCTGCGHDSVSMHIISAFYDLSIPPHRVAKLSGIGCSSKTPAYFLNRSHGFNSVHGRMPSVATGAALMNSSMTNIGVSGDGDTASIGIGQFSHLIRRNVQLAYIIENNGVYGLTKGQFSATADRGSLLKKGEKSPYEAIDLCSLAVDLGCQFVARSFSGDVKQLVPLIKAALLHRGTAIIDVISPCITFNNHEGSTRSYSHVKEHEQYLHELGFIQGAQAIHVDYEAGETKVVKLHDGSQITLKKMQRDYDPTNRADAKKVLEEAKASGEILTGLFYINPDSTTFGETLKVAREPIVHLSEEKLVPSKEALEKELKEFL